ncbi:MAG: hypothetical protein EPO21_18770 [Chloroflexota bacterium]|nr:MAG: hypothetical protein EPO21_18770 [Chloroflexota bacterium]
MCCTHKRTLSSSDPIVPTPVVRFYAEMGRPFALTIASASMWPLIRIGDQVIVDPNLRTCAPGSVVALDNRDVIVVHRVIASRRAPDGRTLIITKGDRSSRADPALPVVAVIGTVVRMRRGRREIDLSKLSWRCINKLVLSVSLAGITVPWARRGLRSVIAIGVAQVLAHGRRSSVSGIRQGPDGHRHHQTPASGDLRRACRKKPGRPKLGTTDS